MDAQSREKCQACGQGRVLLVVDLPQITKTMKLDPSEIRRKLKIRNGQLEKKPMQLE